MRTQTLTLCLLFATPFLVCAADSTVTNPVPAAAPSRPQSKSPTHVEVLKARSYLASGEYGKAEGSLRRALQFTSDEESLHSIHIALADLLREEGRFAESRSIYSAVLDEKGVSARQKFDGFSGVADVDGLTGKPDMASSEWDEAIKASRELKDLVLEADATRGLGMTWLDAGNPSRAEPLLRRALKMMEGAPATAPEQIASALTCLGRCYRMQNKLALAEDNLSRALVLERKAFGENHPQTAYVMERLAEVYAMRNQFELARDYSSRALAVMRASCGENSAAAAAALVNRASVEQRANALDAAAENYAAALKILQSNPEVLAQNSTLEGQILQRYALLLKAGHHDREAREMSATAKSFLSK